MESVLLYAGAGVAAGFLGGLLGIGGGLIVVPVLAASFAADGVADNVLMPLAMGTSLATVMFTSLSSTRAHHVRGAVDWSIVKRMGPGLAIGAAGGALLSSRLPGVVLQAVFVLFAAFAATQLLLGSGATAKWKLPASRLLAVTGGGIGLIAGLVGTGGATLTVPFLTWCSVSIRTAIGCASALALPMAIGGTVSYIVCGVTAPDLPAHTLGYVHLPAFTAIALASVIAAPAGAALSQRLPTSALRRVFAIGLYGAAGKMLIAVL